MTNERLAEGGYQAFYGVVFVKDLQILVLKISLFIDILLIMWQNFFFEIRRLMRRSHTKYC